MKDGVENPFPGLRPFREEEEHLFFGRETQVDALVDTLAAKRFLAVVGVSGSGKSSLVNCGLRPALHRGLMASAGTAWRVAQFRPGNDPIRAMADALARVGILAAGADQGRFSRSDIIETTLRLSKAGLRDAYEQARLPPDTNLLVVADQFEELFRYRALAVSRSAGASASEEATAFVNLLLEAREHTDMPVYVALTMRSDFLGDAAQFFGLPEAINRGQYLVPRLTREERRLAITGPVGVGGGRVTPVLLTRLVNDVGDNPDQLSILQHALNRTWTRWAQEDRPGDPIDLAHYEAIGTMARALDDHAEEAYRELADERRRTICARIFKALTDMTSDPRGTRRPTRMDTLCALARASAAEVAAVIDVFRTPSRAFLMPPEGEALEPATVVDISHESLMRAWSRLRTWAAEEAQSAQTYRRLAETAALHAAGHASLWRDPDLQLVLNWVRNETPDESWAMRYREGFAPAMRFLQHSEAARAAERRSAWRRKAYPVALVLVLVAVLGAWMVKTVRDRARASQAAAILDAEHAARVQAEVARAEAVTARDAARQAEKLAVERTNALLAQFGWDRQKLATTSVNQYAVDQSLTANQAIQRVAPQAGRDRRRVVTVEYFPKNVDENKVEGALTELGFTLRKPPAIVTGIPTNAIWFGSPVSVDDVKLVALTLIRAGVQIRAIHPIQDWLVNKKDLPLIQVGADSSVVNDPVLTVEAIQGAARFTR